MTFQLINCEQRSFQRWDITEEGQRVAEHGSYEARVYNAIPQGGLLQSDLMVNIFVIELEQSLAVCVCVCVCVCVYLNQMHSSVK